MGQIILENIHFHAFHGVFPEENLVGNSFVITLTLDLDLQQASQTDELDDTINYQLIYDVVKAEMDIQSKLIEHVAGRILRSVMKTFPQVNKAEVRLKKINPPLGGQVESAVIVLVEER
jgi:dihydroneopterin aldolase